VWFFSGRKKQSVKKMPESPKGKGRKGLVVLGEGEDAALRFIPPRGVKIGMCAARGEEGGTFALR